MTTPARPPESRPEPARLSLIERTHEVNERLDALDELLEQLARRVEPVLAPVEPEPGLAMLAERNDGASWLADYLTATARRIENTLRTVQAITSRIDL